MNILRLPDLVRVTGLSRTTLWRLEREGTFPPRVRLSENSVGWREDEVLTWLESRPRGVRVEQVASRG